MKLKIKSVLYSSVLIIVLSVCFICAGIGFTSAWLTDRASATVTLTMGKAVSFNLYTASSGGSTTDSIGEKDAVPGERIDFDSVYIRPSADASTCYVRAKIDFISNSKLSADNNSFIYTFDEQTQIKGNDSTYYWVKDSDNYYYLVSTNVITGSNYVGVVSGNNVSSYKLQVTGVKVSDNATNTNGNNHDDCEVKLTVQAIQAANYAYENWAQVDWNA